MSVRARRSLALIAGLGARDERLRGPGPGRDADPSTGAAVASNSDHDYATVNFSDPWDFSNTEDFPLDEAQSFSTYNIANGVLDANVNAGGGLIMAQSVAGSIPDRRSTSLYPIDAGTYRKVSFQMWADHDASGGFFWYSCNHVIPDCENGFAISVKQGWHTYSFDIPSQTTLPEPTSSRPAWAGLITGIRLVPSGGSAVHIMLDWMRLTPPSGSTTPPSPPVPLPVVDSPSAAGGVDYATVVRRDPWDMSQPSDILAPENMSYSFTGSLLSGVNTGPNIDDAHFTLPLAGPIDGNRFHRLTFSVYYTGSFSLGFGPGGGMVARLIWQTAGAPGVWQNSDDIVVYPGWNDVTVDLATSPSWAITDPNTPVRIGWAGQLITSVRFDPDEDSGARPFLIDNIKIAEDTTGYGGATDIKFHDNGWQSGTTADIYTSPTQGGFGGTRIASNLPVTQGVNTFHWAPNPLPSGNVWVYVLFKHGADQARAYATGPLRMTASPSPLYGVSPFGSLEGMSVSPAGAHARGWAIDPDTTNPIRVDFWIDGRSSIGSLMANTTAHRRPACVLGFRFRARLRLGDPGPPGHPLGVRVRDQHRAREQSAHRVPHGHRQREPHRRARRGGGPRRLHVDPGLDHRSQQHRSDPGPRVRRRQARPACSKRTTPAPTSRARCPGTGPNHGYHTNLTLASGAHTVCTYGINTGPGTNSTLGCRSVVLPSNPLGALDVVRTDSGGIKVRGWAIDPDVTGPITVALYVQGGTASTVTADSARPDIATLFPRYGNKHGYMATLPGSGGKHTVCAYGINRAAGANTLLGCATG